VIRSRRSRQPGAGKDGGQQGQGQHQHQHDDDGNTPSHRHGEQLHPRSSHSKNGKHSKSQSKPKQKRGGGDKVGEQQPKGKKLRQIQNGGPKGGQPRRFAVGDAVVCNLGSQEGWKPGAVSMVDVCGNFDDVISDHLSIPQLPKLYTTLHTPFAVLFLATQAGRCGLVLWGL